MPSRDAVDFLILTSSLTAEDIRHLHQLCKLYTIGEIPLDEYNQELIIGRIIQQINDFDSAKAESFLTFIEGLVSGLDKVKDFPISHDIFLISGQNTINTKVTTQTNTITSELLVNLDSSVIALAIDRGLFGKEQLQEILDSIGNRLNKTESSNRKNIKNN